MRTVLWMAVVAMLVACGDSTGSGDGQPGVLDRMFLYDAESNFRAGDSYVFAAHWRALDGVGAELPLDRIGLRYSLGDSVNPGAAVDSTGAFTLEPFIGFLYVFAPTSRAPMERLGQHYINVQP